MQSLEAKQRYLRDNIPENQYEDFFAYLEEHVGNQDIDRWSPEFVLQVPLRASRSSRISMRCSKRRPRP
jgi:hypothetical protein